MQKLLALILTAVSFLLMVPEVSPTVNAARSMTKPQIRVQIGRRHRDRDWRDRNYRYNRDYRYGRTVMQTRYVRRGWATYRETYQVHYLRNGMVQTNLVSRVRVS